MNLTKNPLFYLSLILAVIVGFQAWSLVQAGTFAEPTTAFPASDVSAPVETGEVAQTKYQTLSFAPVADPTDIRVSVGLSGLRLGNEGSPGFATSWDMVKDFVRVWNGPDASGIISYTGGVKIQREGGLLSMEVDSDGNVEIAGSLTVGGTGGIPTGLEGVQKASGCSCDPSAPPSCDPGYTSVNVVTVTCDDCVCCGVSLKNRKKNYNLCIRLAE